MSRTDTGRAANARRAGQPVAALATGASPGSRPAGPLPAASLPLVSLLAVSILAGCAGETKFRPGPEDWTALFNGRDLSGWTVKIAGHEPGDNFARTFRVEDGVVQVRYDGYDDFGDRFGHLYYDRPFSHYRLTFEYRFVGELHPGAPDYARLNSGVMFHSQGPRTMPVDQDWPISVELQLLAGLGDGEPRPTGNMCSPGTTVVYRGERTEAHCIESTSGTYPPGQWVRAELVVLGDSLVTHIIEGDTVLQYTRPAIGGGVVSGHDPAVKVDGTPLAGGFIALQSEGQPVDFRNVRLLDLEGCTDPASDRYRPWYVAADPGACR